MFENNKILSLLVLAIVGSLLLGGAVGFYVTDYYVQQRREALYERREDFIRGVAEGSRYALEFRQWEESEGSPADIRSDPEYRCAVKFYRQNDDALLGCMEGVNGPPEDGYSFPR